MKTVYALVDVADLPYSEIDGKRRLAISLSPDPRVPKPTPVWRQISRSLSRWDGAFHLLNRGITISAQSADYDNQTKILTLGIPDEESYGILDGGHTADAIQSVLAGARSREDAVPADAERRPQFVRLEILIGAEAYLGEIAGARNTSLAVKLFSLKNKEGAFNWLKAAVRPYDTKIRWSENDPEEFPVLELVQILGACNIYQFGPSAHPIDAYKNSGKILEYLLDPDDRYSYRKLAPVAKDIWRLYDTIRYRWWELYNKPHPVTGKHGRAGRLVEVQNRKRGRASLMRYVTLDVNGDPHAGEMHVEKGLAIPALAAFRALLRESPSGKLEWTEDPFDFFERHGLLLVRTVMDASDSRDNNPHAVGRDATVYDVLYRMIESEVTKQENERLRAQLAEHSASGTRT